MCVKYTNTSIFFAISMPYCVLFFQNAVVYKIIFIYFLPYPRRNLSYLFQILPYPIYIFFAISMSTLHSCESVKASNNCLRNNFGTEDKRQMVTTEHFSHRATGIKYIYNTRDKIHQG